jgi:hypothetical protein
MVPLGVVVAVVRLLCVVRSCSAGEASQAASVRQASRLDEHQDGERLGLGAAGGSLDADGPVQTLLNALTEPRATPLSARLPLECQLSGFEGGAGALAWT